MNFSRRLALLAGLSLSLALLSCSDRDPVSSLDEQDATAAKLITSANRAGGVADRFGAYRFSSEVPRAWFGLATNLVVAEGINPMVTSRIFGYTGVALYEAVVPGMPGYQSLAGQLNELNSLPQPKGTNYHWPTVANAALATTLRGLFAGKASTTLAAIDSLEEHFAQEYSKTVAPGLSSRSAAWGQEMGEAILDWASGDGFSEFDNCSYTVPTGSTKWIPTPPAFAAKPLEPCWGQLRPFVLPDGSAYSPGPPMEYSEDPASPYYQAVKEVYDTVKNGTEEQRTIAKYWATGASPSCALLSQVLQQKNASLGVAAEAYAKLNMAVADAVIVCWWNKYQYNTIRPVSYIQRVIDPNWNTVIPTPPHPEYTSGHSTQSGAMAQVLTDLFGNVAFTDHRLDSKGFAPRSFNSFWEAAHETAMSRVYGGIHFRATNERSLELGKSVGSMVNALNFRK